MVELLFILPKKEALSKTCIHPFYFDTYLSKGGQGQGSQRVYTAASRLFVESVNRKRGEGQRAQQEPQGRTHEEGEEGGGQEGGEGPQGTKGMAVMKI